jgi:tRNA A-37 threonylcarbamoyl transferase component Bud32
MVGEVLADRYELEELVGTGGMSSVYRAHDRLLDRKVALKVLHQQYTEDDEYVERFRREARAVAALSHPNIVTVIDRGEHGGRQFIVFEYVDGDNLKQVIERRGPAPVETALELAIQIARGLSFAHQNGLVHRDVKPQNVLLNGDGQAKVTDFGIARSMDVKRGMTTTGTVLGTSDYIAPEQAQGQPVDEHSDVYSLGVVVYEMLTNEVPFSGENFVAVAMRHINDPPPPIRDKRPDVPPRLEAAVHRAMAKDPNERFASMTDFCRELEECLAEVRSGTHTQVAPARERARRRRAWPRIPILPLALLLAALVVAAAVLAYAVTRNGGDGNGGSPGVPTVPHLRGVGAYDPFGDGSEHADDAPQATDQVTSTYWRTEKYRASFAKIGKKGVGLVLDAGRPVRLHELGIVTDTPGFVAVIRAGNTTASFPKWVSKSQQVGSQGAQYAITGGPYRYYLIWITELGQGYDQAHVNEVRVT